MPSWKRSHKLTAYYDALVHVEGTDGYRPRAIAVTWRLDGDGHQHHGTADLSGIQAEALRQGVAAPFRQLTADLPEWSMHLQVSPLDARFPQLVRLSDPRHVHDLLAGAYAASDGTPDQARPGRYTVTRAPSVWRGARPTGSQNTERASLLCGRSRMWPRTRLFSIRA